MAAALLEAGCAANGRSKTRIAASMDRLGPHATLSDEAVRSELAHLLETRPRLRATKERAIAHAQPDIVRQWLLALPVGPDESVIVLWPAYRSGVSAMYRGFVQAYDDLWYPSADDVWVRSLSGDWLIEFDHEEVVRFLVLRPSI